MDLNVPEAQYAEIEKLIGSDTSPVGIDAKKTHIIILAKLLDIQDRLEKLERKTG